MFTGIITDIGRVRRVSGSGDVRFDIATRFDMTTVAVGASIACNGICLTVIETGSDWFAVQASEETSSMTTARTWREGTSLNLERALKLGDELGGHIVSGHVDGIARITDIRPENDSLRYTFEAPAGLARFIAPKGSVALDGVSLTINEVDGARFGVNIIPHTQKETIFGERRAGDPVNMEIDMLARYVARQLGKD